MKSNAEPKNEYSKAAQNSTAPCYKFLFYIRFLKIEHLIFFEIKIVEYPKNIITNIVNIIYTHKVI